MASCTDSIHRFVWVIRRRIRVVISHQLCCTCIGYNIDPIIVLGIFTIQSPHMRPDSLRGSILCFCITGKDNKDLLYFFVTIPIVLREIHTMLVCRIHSLSYHRLGKSVIFLFSITNRMLTIISHLLRSSIGTYHIEVYGQFIITLFFKKVTYRTSHTTFVISFFVEKPFVCLLQILSNELLVGKLHKNNQSSMVSCRCVRRRSCTTGSTLQNIKSSLFHSLVFIGCPYFCNLLLGHHLQSTINHLAWLPLSICIEREVLIAT